jgi:hypothetical protein
MNRFAMSRIMPESFPHTPHSQPMNGSPQPTHLVHFDPPPCYDEAIKFPSISSILTNATTTTLTTEATTSNATMNAVSDHDSNNMSISGLASDSAQSTSQLPQVALTSSLMKQKLQGIRRTASLNDLNHNARRVLNTHIERYV